MTEAVVVPAAARAVRARSPLRALAWKEARDLAWPVGLAVVGLVAVRVFLGTFATPTTEQMALAWFVAVVPPLAAGILGAISIAGEQGGGAPKFLRARAVDVATIVRVKIGAHALATLVVAGLALGLALPAFGSEDWGWRVPMWVARTFAIGLVVEFFTWGVALSFVLPDGLTAAPAAVIAATFWWLLVFWPSAALSGSTEVGLGRFVPALPLVWLVPLVLAWWLARRDAWLAAGPLSGRARLLVLAVGVGACAAFGFSLREPFRVRAISEGHAVVTGPIVSDPRGDAVAFVATPSGGAPRAVLAMVDARRVVLLSVLEAGTRPVAWNESNAFIVEWPDGSRHDVQPNGLMRGASALAGTASPGPFAAEDGQLVRRGTSLVPMILYPPPEQEGDRR